MFVLVANYLLLCKVSEGICRLEFQHSLSCSCNVNSCSYKELVSPVSFATMHVITNYVTCLSIYVVYGLRV